MVFSELRTLWAFQHWSWDKKAQGALSAEIPTSLCSLWAMSPSCPPPIPLLNTLTTLLTAAAFVGQVAFLQRSYPGPSILLVIPHYWSSLKSQFLIFFLSSWRSLTEGMENRSITEWPFQISPWSNITLRVILRIMQDNPCKVLYPDHSKCLINVAMMTMVMIKLALPCALYTTPLPDLTITIIP